MSEESSNAASPLMHLRVQAPHGAALTSAQNVFNQLLMQMQALSAQLQRLHSWSDRHRHAHLQLLHEASNQKAGLQKNLLFFLHERLQVDGLTTQQQRMARRQVRRLITELSPSNDQQVHALNALYQDEDAVHEAEQDSLLAAQRLRQQLEAAIGQPLHNPSLYQTPDEVLAAGMRQWQKQNDADQARKTAKRAERKAQRRPDVHQLQIQQQSDAKSAIRNLYRQLASQLHPDREMDPQTRQRKTRWMGEVNAAYERHDLTTLLQLQLKVAQVDPQHVARISHDKLSAMSLLLKEQLIALQDDVWQLQSRLTQELGVDLDPHSSDERWMQDLQRVQVAHLDAVHLLASDLQRVQQDGELKRWLKAQALRSKQVATSSANSEYF